MFSSPASSSLRHGREENHTEVRPFQREGEARRQTLETCCGGQEACCENGKKGSACEKGRLRQRRLLPPRKPLPGEKSGSGEKAVAAVESSKSRCAGKEIPTVKKAHRRAVPRSRLRRLTPRASCATEPVQGCPKVAVAGRGRPSQSQSHGKSRGAKAAQGSKPSQIPLVAGGFPGAAGTGEAAVCAAQGRARPLPEPVHAGSNGAHSPAFVQKQRQRLLDLRDELVDSMSGMTRDTIRNAPEGSEASGSGQHQGDAGSDAYDRDFALVRARQGAGRAL